MNLFGWFGRKKPQSVDSEISDLEPETSEPDTVGDLIRLTKDGRIQWRSQMGGFCLNRDGMFWQVFGDYGPPARLSASRLEWNSPNVLIEESMRIRHFFNYLHELEASRAVKNREALLSSMSASLQRFV